MNTHKREDISKKLQIGLDKAIKKLIDREKRDNGYLVVSDGKGNIKRIPAKDL